MEVAPEDGVVVGVGVYDDGSLHCGGYSFKGGTVCGSCVPLLQQFDPANTTTAVEAKGTPALAIFSLG